MPWSMYYNLNYLNDWLRDSMGFLDRAAISGIIKPRRDPLDPSREHSRWIPWCPVGCDDCDLRIWTFITTQMSVIFTNQCVKTTWFPHTVWFLDTIWFLHLKYAIVTISFLFIYIKIVLFCISYCIDLIGKFFPPMCIHLVTCSRQCRL